MYKGKKRRKRPWGDTYRFPHPKRPKRPDTVAVNVSAYSHQRHRRIKPGSVELSSEYFKVNRVNSRTPGASVPGYRNKIRMHMSATSPFDGTKFKYTAKNYYLAIRYNGPNSASDSGRLVVAERFGNGDGLSWFSNQPSTPPVLSGPTFDSASNLAVQKLYDTIRQMESHVQTGETIGEYKQTINLFKRGLGGLRDLLEYTSKNHVNILKKGAQWNNAKRTAKSLADLTLEYRFGIKPLAMVLGEGAGAVQSDRYMEAFLPFSVKGKATSSTLVTNGSYGGFPRIHIYGRTDNEFKVRFKGDYRIRSADAGPNYARSLGLTWREFIPTIYNLIPYSFLLDYVSNLHTFIETVAVPFTNVAWCVRTDRSTQHHVRNYTALGGEQPLNYVIDVIDPGYFDSQATGIRRREQLSLPMPTLRWQKPSKRALENTLALVVGRLPVIGNLTKRILRSPSGKTLDNEFRLASRGSDHKVPYPFHRP